MICFGNLVVKSLVWSIMQVACVRILLGAENFGAERTVKVPTHLGGKNKAYYNRKHQFRQNCTNESLKLY